MTVHDGLWLLVDVSLKSALLAVAAAVGMWFCRVRSPTIRHRVWTAVLVGMLAMPLLVAWAPTVKLPTWAYPSLRTEAISQDVAASITPTPGTPVAAVADSRLESSTVAEPQAPARLADAKTGHRIAAIDIAATDIAASPMNGTLPWSIVVLGCYAFGAALFGSRLLLGLAAARNLVRTAQSVHLPPQHATLVGSTRVIESSQALVPITVGWPRPTIVLPSDWATWSDSLLTAALIHEQAHVRRRDVAVSLVAQLNRAMYWFHPVAWFLVRRLTVLAEAACDDEVIDTQGDRAAYARHLVTVAGRLSGGLRRVEPLGVAMAARPAVEQRIDAILDERRPLARRLTIAGSIAIAGLAIPLALFTAGLKAGEPSANSGPTVRGRVVMETDRSPVKGADVRLVTWHENRTRYDTQETQSDVNGEFVFEKVPPGESELVAFFAAFASRKSLYKGQPLATASDGRFAPATLKLAKMPEIDVRVVDKATGKPIAGANVELVWCDTERDHKTNERGETTLQRLTHEVWHVEVKAPGCVKQVQAINLADTDKAQVSFELVPGGKVFGSVRDEAGKPIVGAGISVFPADFRSGQIEYLKTDAVGNYEFGNLPLDVGMVFMVSHDGFLEERPKVALAATSNREQQLDIMLQRRPDGGSVRGTVTDLDGRPIAGAKVTNSGRSSRDVRRATTDEHGVFVLDDVFEGSVGHELIVKAHDFAPQRLSFTPGTQTAPAELDIQLAPGHRIHGHVVDESGKPIAGVRVYSSHGNEGGNMEFGQRTKTDTDGRFAFDSLPDDAPLTFTADGYSEIDATTLLLDGEDDVTVTMQSAGVIRGRVVDAATGQPINSFNVMITFSPDRRPDEPGHHLSGARATSPDGEHFSAADGIFVLNDLMREMPLQVTVAAAGHDRTTLRRVVSKSESETETVEFRLAPVDRSDLIEISGHIVDEQSRPISAAELRLIVARKRPFPRDAFPFNWQMIRRGNMERVDGVLQFLATTSDGDGRFSFHDVLPGPDVEIAYWGEGVSQGRVELVEQLEQPARENVVIAVVPPGIVRGRIDRQAVPGVTSVMLTSTQPGNGMDYYQTEVPSNQSEYKIRNVPPGSYRLQVNGPRARSGVDGFTEETLQRHRVNVVSGETVTLDIGATND